MFTPSMAVASAMRLPDRIAFTLFGFQVYWLGLLLAAGIIVAILLTHLECRRKSLPSDTAIDLCLIVLPCGVIGSRIVYVLLHLPQFQGRAVEMLYLWDGGLSVIGGLIIALAGILIYAFKKRIRFLKLLDTLAPGVTAALAVSSWGYFFNQSFYGPSVANGALKWFPLSVRLDNGSIHLALFFYLFVWLILLFAFLWVYMRKHAKHDGDSVLYFLLLFSLAIAVLSAFRRDGASQYLAEQIAGAALFFLTLLFLLIRSIREKRHGGLMWPAPEETCAEAAEAADKSEPVNETQADETGNNESADMPGSEDSALQD